jgi:exodeoxyribonuclease V alpha subunit
MVVIKGEITKIINFKTPKVVKVKNQKDDKNYIIEYGEFFPIREQDFLFCNAVEVDGVYIPTCKPLVIIPYTEDNIKLCLFKTFKKSKVNNIDEIYAELLSKVEDEDNEQLVYYIDSMIYANKKKKFESLSIRNLSKFLEWWNREHLFRRLYLFGLTKGEIKKSYYSPSELYRKLAKNPFEISSITMVKAADIYKLHGKIANDEQYKCGQISRYIEKVLSFGNLSLELSVVEQEFSFFDDYREALEKKYDIIISSKLVYTAQTFKVEEYVSEQISKRILENNKEKKRLEKTNKPLSDSDYRVFPEPNLVLTDEQERALAGVLRNHITIITGGAGCGKTTMIKQIIKNLIEKDEKYMLTSLTGKAVLRMREVVGLKENVSQTMHRMVHNCVKIKKFFNLIIDETSMIPTELFYNFLTEFDYYFKIIFVGDDNQLPPIGKGNLFRDLIDCGQIPIFNLSINKRFANNNILINANNIVNKIKFGKELEFQNGNGFYILDGDIDKCKKIIQKLKTNNIDQKNITVLTPVRKYIEPIVEFHRENFLQSKKFIFKDMTFMVGDRVMQNKNIYLDNSYDIMNGEEGYVTIITSEHVVVDYGNNKILKYSYIESISDKVDNEKMEEINPNKLSIKDIKLSFAKTIHCSQGSEYDYVILYVPNGIDKFMTINLFYTGMTRAKKTIWIVGKIETIFRCTNNFIKKSPSLLGEKIKKKLLLPDSC